MKKVTITIVLLAMSVLFGSSSTLAQESLSCELEYTVQAGDWLSFIAEKYLGSPLAYTELMALANSSTEDSFTNIDNPDLIEPGWVLCIPKIAEGAMSAMPSMPEGYPDSLSPESLKNATYQSEWTQAGTATLVNGEHNEEAAPSSASTNTVTLTDNIAYGELNGQPSAVAVLYSSGGGSGTFGSLAVMVDQDGVATNITNANLGDRVKINSLTVADNQVTIDMVQAGPDDPMCCPSQQVIKTFALQDGVLTETSSTVVDSSAGEAAGSPVSVDSVMVESREAVHYAIVSGNLPDSCTTLGAPTQTVEGNTIKIELLTVLPPADMMCAMALVPFTEEIQLDTTGLEGGEYTVDVNGMTATFSLGVPANLSEVDASSALDDTVWVLTTLNGVADTTVSLKFDNVGNISGSSGCNNYAGSTAMDGNNITITLGPSTMMACEDVVNEQETAYQAMLGMVASYQLENDTLSLLDADGNVVATFAPMESVTLAGSSWIVTFYNNGQQGAVSVIAETEITAVFGEDGTLSGSSGCNTYKTTYEAVDGTISIGPAITTRMACEGVMDQESQYLTALSTASTYTIELDSMDMRTAEGAIAVQFMLAP
ncbi:META domain-containing protein [Anaerolineales bacterium HSG25]|nr:META domain-containing protein [Anaerolineales bacterium HSG25]